MSCCKVALIGGSKGQMAGAAGSIDMAKGNGMGAAVIEAAVGWGMVGRLIKANGGGRHGVD